MSDATTRLPLAIGDRVGDKYRITGLLGQGAIGCVYEATHELLGDQVAIKCVREPPSASVSGRFIREAQVARAIQSSHAVKVLDAGMLEGKGPFLVMERLRGHDLGEHLRACGAFSQEQTIELLLQLCEVLGEAHKLGIVHRDLKPANLFLAEVAGGAPQLKVLDFGVAKVLSPSDHFAHLSESGGPVGTPLYMSPEQIRQEQVDGRSDFWSVGVLVFQMLTERLPFEGSSFGSLAVKICTEKPLSLRELRPELPEPLLGLVSSCLSQQREQRPPSVLHIVETLAPLAPPSCAARLGAIRQRALHGVPSSSLHPPPAPPDQAAATSPESGPRAPAATPEQPKRGRVGVAGVALTLLVGLVVAHARQQGNHREQASSEASVTNSPLQASPPAARSQAQPAPVRPDSSAEKTLTVPPRTSQISLRPPAPAARPAGAADPLKKAIQDRK